MNETPTYDEEYLARTLLRAFEEPEFYNVPKGIIRFDYGSTHAWRVNIARDKAKFVEYFYDGQSGSVENGLRRAILYRHELLAAFPVTLKVRSPRALDADPAERVRRVVEAGKLRPYVAWVAVWHDANHNRRTKNFSVLKYGEDGAREMALRTATINHNSSPKQHRQTDPHIKEEWRKMSRSEVEAVASANDYSLRRRHEDPVVEGSFPFGFEGGRRFALHQAIERDRALRNRKVAQFLTDHGRLFCEACHFNFRERYGFLEKDIIEVHHIVPLAQLTSTTVVSYADLMLLCSNCHTAVHQGDATVNLPLLRSLQPGAYPLD